MEVRSVTLFAEWDLPKVGLADFLAEARVAFPVPVQTVRWATPPFPDWWRVGVAVGEEVAEIAGTLQELGVNYLSLGAVQLGHDVQWLEMIPALLGARGMVFAAAEVAKPCKHGFRTYWGKPRSWYWMPTHSTPLPPALRWPSS